MNKPTKVEKKSPIIKYWETTCRLCEKKIRCKDKDEVAKKLENHIDNDCGVAKVMRIADNMTPREIAVMNKVMK